MSLKIGRCYCRRCAFLHAPGRHNPETSAASALCSLLLAIVFFSAWLVLISAVQTTLTRCPGQRWRIIMWEIYQHCTDQESNNCLLSISPIGDHFLREIMSGSGAAKILNAREKGHSIPVCKFIRVSSLQHCDKYPGVPSHSSRAVLWTR